MNWLNRMERRFGRFALPNLPLYIVILYAIGTVMNYATNGAFYLITCFNPYLVIQEHQFWRIFTFVVSVQPSGLTMAR